MSILEFENSQLNHGNEYNYEIPDSRDITQFNNDNAH